MTILFNSKATWHGVYTYYKNNHKDYKISNNIKRHTQELIIKDAYYRNNESIVSGKKSQPITSNE